MFRKLTSTAKLLIQSSQAQCKIGTVSHRINFQSRFVSTALEKVAEPQPDKLYKRVIVEMRGNDPAVMKSYAEFAGEAAKHLDICLEKEYAPAKPDHERHTVLKSKHVHKKHRVQYEYRTYYRFMYFYGMTGSTADTYLEYIERNLPEGVALKVTKVEIKPLVETVKQAPSAIEAEC